MKFVQQENHGRVFFILLQNRFSFLFIFLKRFDIDLPELGSIALGITDLRKELIKNNEEDIPMEIIHTYDFNCSCAKCTFGGDINRIKTTTFDLLSTFPDEAKYQQENPSVETVYDSFTLALMSKRKFDLRASIIIFNSDKINNRFLFFKIYSLINY